MKTQDWSPLGWTGWIPLQSKGLSSLLQYHSSKASILQHAAFFIVQLSHPYMATGKTITLTRWTFVGKVMSLLFIMLSRLVIAFLPRSKRLLISWLQSPSAVIYPRLQQLIAWPLGILCSVTKLCPTLCDPMDYNPPGSFVLGVLQARILEWVAISSQRDLPNWWIEPKSPAFQADSLLFELQGIMTHLLSHTHTHIHIDMYIHTHMFFPYTLMFKNTIFCKMFITVLFFKIMELEK